MLRNNHGQNAIEYLLLLTIVVIVLVVALAPNGLIPKAVDDSLNASVSAIENMVNNVW